MDEPGIISFKGVQAQIACRDALSCLKSLKKESVDLIVSSPPYCMGKEYDASHSLHDFRAEIRRLTHQVKRVLKPTGNMCWQVGNYVADGQVFPLDAEIICLLKRSGLRLRNRIIWHFGHGTHAQRRFSGRYETILWYSRGDDYFFDLDTVREPQKYPGKRHYKGPRKGEFSGNPLGKNPSDVWEIPNVNANHVEKTDHPCQFPVALVQRLVRALTPMGGCVVDPYAGSGTAAVAALIEGRRFVGSDTCQRYVDIARQRLEQVTQGQIKVRADRPAVAPDPGASVSQAPPHFVRHDLARGKVVGSQG